TAVPPARTTLTSNRATQAAAPVPRGRRPTSQTPGAAAPPAVAVPPGSTAGFPARPGAAARAAGTPAAAWRAWTGPAHQQPTYPAARHGGMHTSIRAGGPRPTRDSAPALPQAGRQYAILPATAAR